MKKGYHSTQSKAFNTIPRSEYLGVVLGFAIGMFLTGALHWDNRILELIGAVALLSAGGLTGNTMQKKIFPLISWKQSKQRRNHSKIVPLYGK